MADEPVKVNVQSRRVDLSILPNTFSQPYQLYVIQQNSDMLNIADATNNAGTLAYEATVKNEEQDVILADHESRISELRIEVDDHEIRISSNTSAISSLSLRVTTAEGNITSLQASLASLTTRVTTAEGNITSLQGDYVSKTTPSSQSLASPLNVNTSYSVGGTKVVGARRTGWTASSGTANRGAFNADQTFNVSNPPTQSEMQAMAAALTAARQRIKAIEDDDRAHGLIN